MPRWLVFSIVVLGGIALSLWMLVRYTTTNFNGVRAGAPFLDAHQRAITSFAEQEGFGNSRLRRKRFWNNYSVSFTGVQYPVTFIHLVGSGSSDQPRLYTDGRPPKKKELKRADQRSITEAESSAWSQVVEGADFATIEEDSEEGYLRIMAPLVAREDCAECHQVATGTLLGGIHLLTPSGPAIPQAGDLAGTSTRDQRQTYSLMNL
ncbi:MAG: hypothetical protein ACPGVU_01870 [Limisphaerales bacterium]